MSASVVIVAESIDDLLVLERFEGWDRKNDHVYSAEYGVIPTENGDLGVLVEPASPLDPPRNLYLGTRGSLTELRVIGESFKTLRSESTRNLKKLLGFSKTYAEDPTGMGKIVTTFPTSGYINNVLATIYAHADEKSHMTFVDSVSESGHAFGKEFIERLAKDQIIMSSPRGTTSIIGHDVKDHVHGYCRLDPDTFAAIRRRAQQLQDEDKLQTYRDGTLSIQEAKDFAEAIERLSGNLGREEYTNDKVYLPDYLYKIALGSGPAVLRGAKVVQMRRGLIGHRKWLDQRVQELLAA